MDNILSFATEKASRGTLRKLWNKSEDAAMVKALDKQLTHAFHIFQVSDGHSRSTFRCSISLTDPIGCDLSKAAGFDDEAAC